MKKILALLVALSLCLLPALAESEIRNVNWSDIEQSVAANGIEGSFWTLNDVAIQFWVPTMLQQVESDQEDVLCRFETADNSATVLVQYLKGAEGASVADLAATLSEGEEAAEIEQCLLNGFGALLYKVPAADSQCVAIATDSGDFIQFVFHPLSDETFHQLAQIMAASIMPEN